MNEFLMPDWMLEIKHKQVVASLRELNTERETILCEALIRAEALRVWKEFIRELAIQIEQCSNLEGIGKSSFSLMGDKEFGITICGSGPLASAKIRVVRFCEPRGELPYVHCLCQDGAQPDFRMKFCVDSKGNVRLFTDGPVAVIEAASFVLAPIVRSFTG